MARAKRLYVCIEDLSFGIEFPSRDLATRGSRLRCPRARHDHLNDAVSSSLCKRQLMLMDLLRFCEEHAQDDRRLTPRSLKDHLQPHQYVGGPGVLKSHLFAHAVSSRWFAELMHGHSWPRALDAMFEHALWCLHPWTDIGQMLQACVAVNIFTRSSCLQASGPGIFQGRETRLCGSKGRMRGRTFLRAQTCKQIQLRHPDRCSNTAHVN